VQERIKYRVKDGEAARYTLSVRTVVDTVTALPRNQFNTGSKKTLID
jgi:hypothetical protein